MGGTIARYSAEGVETSLVTAAEGKLGVAVQEEPNPGPATWAGIRMAELLGAAPALRACAMSPSSTTWMATSIRRTGPAMGEIVGHTAARPPASRDTFGPDGAYGHPDHIAICQFTTRGRSLRRQTRLFCAGGSAAHRVAKLYYRVFTAEEFATFRVGLRQRDASRRQSGAAGPRSPSGPSPRASPPPTTGGACGKRSPAIRRSCRCTPCWKRCPRSATARSGAIRRTTACSARSMAAGGRETDLFEGLR